MHALTMDKFMIIYNIVFQYHIIWIFKKFWKINKMKDYERSISVYQVQTKLIRSIRCNHIFYIHS